MRFSLAIAYDPLKSEKYQSNMSKLKASLTLIALRVLKLTKIGGGDQMKSPQIIKYTKNWNRKDKDMEYIIFIYEVS